MQPRSAYVAEGDATLCLLLENSGQQYARELDKLRTSRAESLEEAYYRTARGAVQCDRRVRCKPRSQRHVNTQNKALFSCWPFVQGHAHQASDWAQIVHQRGCMRADSVAIHGGLL